MTRFEIVSIIKNLEDRAPINDAMVMQLRRESIDEMGELLRERDARHRYMHHRREELCGEWWGLDHMTPRALRLVRACQRIAQVIYRYRFG